MSFSDVGSTMSTRPDRPLIVKATFDRYNKRITFSSARNCSYDLLRSKVEQSFSLQAFSFSIAYKDDDGEVTDITCEGDLTEAIQYFQAGVDDLPVSSAASILSGRSFGSRRITLRVSVTVDYDGPSLSDTSSLVSLEEYKNRNGSGSSMSLSLSFSDASQMEPEDDSVTVSSRDMGSSMLMVNQKRGAKTVVKTNGAGTGSGSKTASGPGSGTTVVHDFQSVSAFDSEADANAFDQRYPADPSAVFERLKLSDSSDSTERSTQWLRDQKSRNDINGIASMHSKSKSHSQSVSVSGESVSDGSSLVLDDDLESQSPLDGDLALQQDNGKFYYTYTSSSSSAASASAGPEGQDGQDIQEDGSYSVSDGEIRRFSEQSGNMRWLASQQTLIQPLYVPETRMRTRWQAQSPHKHQHPHQHLHPRTSTSSSAASSSSSSALRKPSISSSTSDPLPLVRSSVGSGSGLANGNGYIAEDVPPEVLQFINENPQPPMACTECSACGVRLDTLRYVCSTCGEKTPRLPDDVLSEIDMNVYGLTNGKGKARDDSNGSDSSLLIDPFSDPYSYPPSNHRTKAPPLPHRPRPLPTLPTPLPSPTYGKNDPMARSYGSLPGSTSSSTTLAPGAAVETGFELCPTCIETAGVFHALAGCTVADSTTTANNNSNNEPSSPQDSLLSLSALRRAAPKQKGRFRHAYVEKLWSASGWRDVEQDLSSCSECTICQAKLTGVGLDGDGMGRRYKCASCTNFVLCRACYSQVHEIHPSHAFLDVPERMEENDVDDAERAQMVRARSEPDLETANPFGDDVPEDESLIHPGVKCTHCLMDIVGARFHCAICENVDICSNCEAAGLPGNLDADDGGHNSSHIMIKIPIPLKSDKVQTASRRARQLWQGRDAPTLQQQCRADSNQAYDTDVVTVVGTGGRSAAGHARSGSSRNVRSGEARSMDHHILCKGCNQSIVGVRYQCAACPSTNNQAYSLCANCEPRSYFIHDPMHIFFKLPRPVDRPIESQFPILPVLYRQPAGPRSGEILNSSHPKAYLSSLHHTAALCDHCMERISGEWFRCVYCPKDLCDVCENLNAHNPTHFFYVFKAPVDMQMFRIVAELDNPNGSPPVLKYPVYYS